MSHRVSYDQYGTSGGILAADLSGAQAATNGQQIVSNGGRYAHISMSGGALGSALQTNASGQPTHARNH